MIDRASETWNDIARWAEEQLDRARNRLEEPDTPLLETERLRERIRVLRQLGKLGMPRPDIPRSDTPYTPGRSQER